MIAQQLAYFSKAYLLLKVLWINHVGAVTSSSSLDTLYSTMWGHPVANGQTTP